MCKNQLTNRSEHNTRFRRICNQLCCPEPVPDCLCHIRSHSKCICSIIFWKTFGLRSTSYKPLFSHPSRRIKLSCPLKRYLFFPLFFILRPLSFDCQNLSHIASSRKMVHTFATAFTLFVWNMVLNLPIFIFPDRKRIKSAHTLTGQTSHTHLIFCELTFYSFFRRFQIFRTGYFCFKW